MATPKILAERLEVVSVDDLLLHPENPKKGDVDAISESIDTVGFWSIILVQRSTNYVLAGNHRLLAARRSGMGEVPVVFLDVDDDTAKRILLGDNRYAELGVWDDRALLSILEPLPDLAGTGFTPLDLDLLRQGLDGADDDPGDGGRVPSEDVKVTIGTVSFTVTRDRFDGWFARLTADVGMHHDAHVRNVCEALQL